METVNGFSDQNVGQIYSPRFAGFLVRFIAFVIDTFALLFITYMTNYFFSWTGLYSPWIWVTANTNYTLHEEMGLLVAFINVVAFGLYYVLFTSSRFMGTPGKIIFGLKVTDLEFKRIGLGKSMLRFLIRDGWVLVLDIVLPPLVLLVIVVRVLTFLLVFVTKRRQALHDIIAGTIVVKSK